MFDIDGDAHDAKRIANNYLNSTGYSQETKTYFIKSSVLGGQTVTEYSRTTKGTTIKTRYKSYVHAARFWQVLFQPEELAYGFHNAFAGFVLLLFLSFYFDF